MSGDVGDPLADRTGDREIVLAEVLRVLVGRVRQTFMPIHDLCDSGRNLGELLPSLARQSEVN